MSFSKLEIEVIQILANLAEYISVPKPYPNREASGYGRINASVAFNSRAYRNVRANTEILKRRSRAPLIVARVRLDPRNCGLRSAVTVDCVEGLNQSVSGCPSPTKANVITSVTENETSAICLATHEGWS